MKISKSQWQKIAPLLRSALDLDPAGRVTWLADVERTEGEVAPLLKKMLAAHDAAERSSELETVPKLVHPPSSLAFESGDMVAAYRLVRLLGRGGMGEVWLADQADGRITRQVALKLPTRVQHLDAWRRRFARERDILAKLTHKNIARLFDAGVDDKLSVIGIGQPYLALEYIEGQPLNQYADARALSIRERLMLFRQVLAATTHAHQHLIVHRDLKPSNILVTSAGDVKLLDFGIAKLIADTVTLKPTDLDERPVDDADLSELTGIGMRLMTLRYAAPEQVTAGEVTTATDVYSLGVLLHELMTGQSPYPLVRDGKPLLEAALLGHEMTKPSFLKLTSSDAMKRKAESGKALASQLAGDLDSIILKAIRPDPAGRYASVEKLDDDILRHLERRPVKARDGTLPYRLGRFLTRNKLPVAGAAVLLVTISAGAVIVEKQRRVAVAEGARAEKHIKSIRKLSTSLMFDVDDKLREVQGATAARAELAANTSRYLAELAKEVGNDREFRLELARAFSRLGDIQGRVNAQNVGKFSDALASYDQSILLLDKAAETPVADKLAVESLETLIYALKEKSRVLNLLGRINEAVDASKMGLQTATELANMPNATAQQKLLKASLMVEAGRHRAWQQQQPQIRKQAIIDAISWVRTLDFEQMDSGSGIKKYEPSDTLAWLHSELGHMLRREPAEESKRQAIEMFRFALAIREARSAAEPENTSARRSIAAHFISIATAQRDLRQLSDALSLYEKAVEIIRGLIAKDANDQQLRADLVEALDPLAAMRLELGQDQGVLSAVLEARNNFERLPAEMRATQAKQKTLERLLRMEAQARSSIAPRSSVPAVRSVRKVKS